MPVATEAEQVILGEQRYVVERFWGRWPDNTTGGVFSMLAVDSSGAVYVARRQGAPVVVLEANGDYRGEWDIDGVTDPHGINIDCRDRVLLVDRDAHEIQIRSIDGTLLSTLGVRNRPRFQAPFNHPTSAFATVDGEIYVADGYGNSSLHRFAGDGTHIASWGTPGAGPGEFSTPHSVWVDQRDRVLVADRENNRICVYDREGNYRTSWTGFYHPMDITEDKHGGLYVSDQVPSVTRLDADGRFVGRCRPVWNVPHGLACAADGTIYFVEMQPNSITVMRPVSGD